MACIVAMKICIAAMLRDSSATTPARESSVSSWPENAEESSNEVEGGGAAVTAGATEEAGGCVEDGRGPDIADTRCYVAARIERGEMGKQRLFACYSTRGYCSRRMLWWRLGLRG